MGGYLGRGIMIRRVGVALILFLNGCGPHHVIPDASGGPAKVVVSAYTNDGCIENLNEEAAKLRVKVRLIDVKSDLGWGIFLWPIYKSYTCTGEVVK